MDGEQPWILTADGIAVTIRVTPKGGRDTIEGIARLADGRLAVRVRVRAPASEGAANAAVIRLMAGALGASQRNVALVGGASARVKRLAVAGDGPALAAMLARIVAEG